MATMKDLQNTSILVQLSSNSLKKGIVAGIIGSVLWLLIMLFHFINGAAGYPLYSNFIYMTSDATYILSASFFVIFIYYLYKYQTNSSLKRTFFILYLGFLLRLAGRLGDTVINALVNVKPIARSVYYLSDTCNLIGVTAFSTLMLILFIKEHKTAYKAICFASFIISLLHIGIYVLIFLYDLSMVPSLNAQLTRLVSLFLSLTFIIYFSHVLSDCNHRQTTSSDSLNM